MRFSWSWLLSHLETSHSPEEIAEKLTSLGCVVDKLSNPLLALKPFRFAFIEAVQRHPNADRLNVCTVRQDDQLFQIVCGASNVRAGAWGVLALPGMVIPQTQSALGKGKIRGVESEGMLCSWAELGFSFPSDQEDGIILTEKLPPSGDVVDLVPAGAASSFLFEVEVTPNRGDWMSVHGIAKELHAAQMGTLKALPKSSPFISPPSSSLFQISSEAQPHMPYLAMALVEGVDNTNLSPFVEDLLSVSMKSHSVLVDLTNWMSQDRGRPLHVFDADQIDGGLVFDLSREGELFESLEGKEYNLPAGLLVARDNQGILALAGVMGAKRGSVSLETRRVLLESAFFDPLMIAQSGQKTHLLSDARARFERGVDPESVPTGLETALRLILTHAGGVVKAHHVFGKASSFPQILLNVHDYQRLIGDPLTTEEAIELLERLGFKHSAGKIQVPSWRFDCHENADLVEEILRLKGYENLRSVHVSFEPPFAQKELSHSFRRLLAAQGLMEVATWSFIDAPSAEAFQGALASPILENPLSQEMKVMRPSLLPSLLKLAAYHEAHRIETPGFFEFACRFERSEEKPCLTLLIPFSPTTHWQKTETSSAFTLKEKFTALMELAGCALEDFNQEALNAPWAHPGRSGLYRTGHEIIAQWGEIHPQYLKQYDLKERWGALEIFMEHDEFLTKSRSIPRPISQNHPLMKDLAFWTPKDMPAERLIKALQHAGGIHLNSLKLFDRFENEEGISLAFRLSWDFARSCTENEIGELLLQLVEAAEKIGATLKGDRSSIKTGGFAIQ